MLEVRDLGVWLEGRAILDHVSLVVEPGRIVGLLGPNGAGKTTCFRAILGQLPRTSGVVLLEGEDIARLPMHRRARKGIGYLPQESSIFRGLDVSQNIMSVLETRSELNRTARIAILDQLLKELQIARIAHHRGSVLSGGERRRVELARALAADPSYVLLDEPFAGVDPVSVQEIQRLVRFLTEKNIGVLITDHNVRETLKLCDHAYILSRGRVLAEGTPAEIVARDDVRGIYLGEDFTLS
ncbi:MAG: LPS export ABC transporter ATP-binding protein [Planctomycetes bacterium]|nr:LPS export ABC transporter ATP-binding protein [Planctomycetota bacterium]